MFESNFVLYKNVWRVIAGNWGRNVHHPSFSYVPVAKWLPFIKGNQNACS